ncbi:MAG: hypothetical protein QF894_07125 [Alphaproteobacteria bacterium]|jgi:hypothetical protein|nr:hypothetical protein [Alphaproteobacteria bacterium]
MTTNCSRRAGHGRAVEDQTPEGWWYCPVDYLASRAREEQLREQYTAWRAGLSEVERKAMSGAGLGSIELIPLRAEAEPWAVRAGRRATLLDSDARPRFPAPWQCPQCRRMA